MRLQYNFPLYPSIIQFQENYLASQNNNYTIDYNNDIPEKLTKNKQCNHQRYWRGIFSNNKSTRVKPKWTLDEDNFQTEEVNSDYQSLYYSIG